MSIRSGIYLAVAMALVLAGCDKKPDVRFAPYDKAYAGKPDFAEIEREYPITPKQLDSLTPENLATLPQEQVDQIYARLSAGVVPDGAYEGTFFLSEGGGLRRLSEVMGGLKGVAINIKLNKLEHLGQALWKGKVFFKEQGILRNMIRDREYLQLVIDGDPDALPTTNVNGVQTWLLFPAKVYCGQSLLDSRRESIVIDYAFSDDIEGYREKPDFLAGRRGLKVRDEIRMIRPGFYLGRAYMDRVFVLNFTLYNKAVADQERSEFLKAGNQREDCWLGTQRITTAALDTAGSR